MGNPVTVDSDDLEKIVMVTGVVKQFEKIINQHKNDPFVCQDQFSLSSAHNRLAREMVRSKRGELHPDYNEILTQQAAKLLTEISYAIGDNMRFPIYIVSPSWMKPTGSQPAGFSELRQKGMIEIGSVFEYVLWQNDPKETREDKAEFRARITDRGSKLLSEMATKEAESVQ